MSKIIGITGGIGSGKTTLVNYIKSRGFTVYIADEAGKKIMETPSVVAQINNLFNQEVLLPNGMLDRVKIAALVFNNKALLKQLNEIVHPAVAEDFSRFLKDHKQEQLIFKETAILFENNLHKTCDATILITAPLDLRIDRVMKRDGLSREEILKRVQNQLPDEEKAKLATYVVENIILQKAYSKVDAIVDDLLHKN